MRREDTKFLRSILGKGKIIEVEFIQYADHLDIEIVTEPEYDSLYTLQYCNLHEYSKDSKAMNYLKQIYPDFEKCYVYTYNIVGPKDREKYGWNALKETEYYDVYEHDCIFVITVPNIKKLNLSSEEENVNIKIF